MIPPTILDVSKRTRKGITIIGKVHGQHGPTNTDKNRANAETILKKHAHYTLWRPLDTLRGNTKLVLVSYYEQDKYQLNNNTTSAIYRATGYQYLIITWFDNKTEEQIA